jgi:hypothetical protein
MHVPITVGRGLWGAVADAEGLRERYNFPIGWDGAWDRVENLKRGSGLGGWDPIQPRGGAVQGPPTGAEGGVREIWLSEGTGIE